MSCDFYRLLAVFETKEAAQAAWAKLEPLLDLLQEASNVYYSVREQARAFDQGVERCQAVDDAFRQKFPALFESLDIPRPADDIGECSLLGQWNYLNYLSAYIQPPEDQWCVEKQIGFSGEAGGADYEPFAQLLRKMGGKAGWASEMALLEKAWDLIELT